MSFAWLTQSESGLGLVVRLVFVGAVVVLAGVKVARYADAIGGLLNLSRAWIGLLFLAVITSVPELVTSVGAVTFENAPDIALGDLFGSNVFNLMIIVVLDAVQGRGPIMLHAGPGQILTAAGSLVLVAVAALGVAVTGQAGELPAHYGTFFALAILVIYGVLVRVTFRFERACNCGSGGTEPSSGFSPSRAYIGFAVSGAAIILSGLVLIKLGADLADFPFRVGDNVVKLGQSTVGTFVIAVITSLPELIVTLAAFHLGSVDMALGNLFGSNMCNMAIVGIVELAYRQGSVFAVASGVHVLTALIVVALTAVAIAGLTCKSRKSFLFLGWDVIAMILICILGLAAILLAGIRSVS